MQGSWKNVSLWPWWNKGTTSDHFTHTHLDNKDFCPSYEVWVANIVSARVNLDWGNPIHLTLIHWTLYPEEDKNMKSYIFAPFLCIRNFLLHYVENLMMKWTKGISGIKEYLVYCTSMKLNTGTVLLTVLCSNILIPIHFPYTSLSLMCTSTDPTLKFLSSEVHLMLTTSSGWGADRGPHGMSKSRMFCNASLSLVIMSPGICKKWDVVHVKAEHILCMCVWFCAVMSIVFTEPLSRPIWWWKPPLARGKRDVPGPWDHLQQWMI